MLGEVLHHSPSSHGQSLDDVVSWLAGHRAALNHQLHRDGAVVFRGFPLTGARDFARFVQALDDRVARYVGQTDRVEVQDRVYESTPVPGAFPIPLHSESAYSAFFPTRGFFWCERPADSGGASLLADTRQVLAALDAELVARFEAKRVEYVRHAPPSGHWAQRLSKLTRSGIVKSWPDIFHENDRDAVSAFCAAHHVPMTWKEAGWLDLSATLPAVLRHPVTGERVWFNQAHLFRLRSSSHPRIGALFSRVFNGLTGYPVMDSRFGTGEPISSDDIREIVRAFRAVQQVVALMTGDVLVFDNMLVAHGRQPFQGERRLLVSFSDYVSSAELEGGP